MRSHWERLRDDPSSSFSELSKVGMWYAEVQFSSISAERCFGKMRSMEQGQRLAMEEPSFKTEMLCRCNKRVVDNLMQRGVTIAKQIAPGKALAEDVE